MSQGRPKTNESLNQLRGNPGKRKQQSAKLPPSTGKIGIVGHLHKSVHNHCSELARYITKSGAPIAIMRPIFDRYCKHLQLAHDAYVIANTKRRPRDNEGIKKLIAEKQAGQKRFKEHSETALKLEKQMIDIIKLGGPQEPKSDPLAEFLKRGGGKPYAVGGGKE